MQPSSDRPTSATSTRTLRRYGPLIAIVVVVAFVAGALVLSGGGDDSEDEGTGATENLGEDALSFSQAEEDGVGVDWPETCDERTGRLAIPDYFAPECYAPF